MNKKQIFVTILIFLLIIGGVYVFISKKDVCPKTCTYVPIKTEKFSVFNGQVTFTLPSNWNAYNKGDSVEISSIEDAGNSSLSFFSASAAGTPVTFGDINWTQLDFFLSNQDLFTEQFIRTMSQPSSQTKVTEISNQYFTIYAQQELLPSGQTPTKDQSGGTIYYLRPKISDPKWNVIINKQALGDSEFESQVNQIIKSLKLISSSS